MAIVAPGLSRSEMRGVMFYWLMSLQLLPCLHPCLREVLPSSSLLWMSSFLKDSNNCGTQDSFQYTELMRMTASRNTQLLPPLVHL